MFFLAAKLTWFVLQPSTFLLLLLLAPAFLATAIAIRSEGPGPIFYTQQRIGRRGRPFAMIKFRSMVRGADDQLASLLDLQGTTNRPFFKVTNDPRITRVGRFIRRHSIDELPQLLNVVAGQMSLVGPRPQRPEEVAAAVAFLASAEGRAISGETLVVDGGLTRD